MWKLWTPPYRHPVHTPKPCKSRHRDEFPPLRWSRSRGNYGESAYPPNCLILTISCVCSLPISPLHRPGSGTLMNGLIKTSVWRMVVPAVGYPMVKPRLKSRRGLGHWDGPIEESAEGKRCGVKEGEADRGGVPAASGKDFRCRLIWCLRLEVYGDQRKGCLAFFGEAVEPSPCYLLRIPYINNLQQFLSSANTIKIIFCKIIPLLSFLVYNLASGKFNTYCCK
jgi:hypothetical protein